MGAFPFEIEDAPERVTFFLPTFSAVKFSNSDRDGPDTLETTEPPCASSPTHMSYTRLSTAIVSGKATQKPPASFPQLEIMFMID